MAKLTEAQNDALDWLHRDGSPRQWLGGQYCAPSEPAITSLDSLVRRGLAIKTGSAGWAIKFAITESGRLALSEGGGNV